MLKTFIAEEEGATAIEYALIASLIAIAIITAVTALSSRLSAVFTTVSTSI